MMPVMMTKRKRQRHDDTGDNNEDDDNNKYANNDADDYDGDGDGYCRMWFGKQIETIEITEIQLNIYSDHAV